MPNVVSIVRDGTLSHDPKNDSELRSGEHHRSVSPQPAAPQADETDFADTFEQMALEVGGYNRLIPVDVFRPVFRQILKNHATPEAFGKYYGTRSVLFDQNYLQITAQKELAGGIHHVALLEKSRHTFQPDRNQIHFTDGTLIDLTKICKHLVFSSFSSKFRI